MASYQADLAIATAVPAAVALPVARRELSGRLVEIKPRRAFAR